MMLCRKLISKVNKLIIIALLFFVHIGRLAIGLDSDTDVPLKERIHAQQTYHSTKDSIYHTYPELADEHLNTFAFLCGRCQICHAPYYFTRAEKDDLPLDCTLGCCMHTTYLPAGFGSCGSMLGGPIWNCVVCMKDLPKAPVCNLIPHSLTIAGTACLALCVCHGSTGVIIYCCADCMGKEEFKHDFRRGLYCAPTDCCAPTNLWLSWSNCWNPCCGKSEYKIF